MAKFRPTNGILVMWILRFTLGEIMDLERLLVATNEISFYRATFRVFKIERKMHGHEDLAFLERVFQKLLLNFTWLAIQYCPLLCFSWSLRWVNRKDAGGNNIFEGGFLGLDNIGAFNRSEPLPTGGTLRQADGTAWMAFYCLNMLNIALELAKHNPVYEDIASKFFEVSSVRVLKIMSSRLLPSIALHLHRWCNDIRSWQPGSFTVERARRNVLRRDRFSPWTFYAPSGS